MRLRDIGDAHVCSAAGVAIAVGVAVLLTESEAGPAWGGQLWPYRPLALTPGRYILRVRGMDIGPITVAAVRATGDREVADFTGDDPPTPLLRRLAEAGGAGRPGRGPSFPRVAGDVEPTPVAAVLAAMTAGLRRTLGLPYRLTSRRGWGRERLRGAPRRPGRP